MNVSRAGQRGAALVAVALAACAGPPPQSTAEAEGPSGPKLSVTAGALAFAGAAGARFTVVIRNRSGQEIVRRTLDTEPGDGLTLTAILPCDADPDEQENVATLILDALYDANGDELPLTERENPTLPAGAISEDFVCVENADTRVAFSIGVMTSGEQGFADVTLDLDATYCNAKADCTDDDGAPLKLLINQTTGEREATIVLGLACTSGPGRETFLYRSDVVITCGDGTVYRVEPSGGPGNLGPHPPLLYQTAAYFGRELIPGLDKCFWNMALGVDLDALRFHLGCSVEMLATVTSEAFDGGVVPSDLNAYPVIRWDLTAESADGETISCGQEPLDGGTGAVTVDYAAGGDTLDNGYTCGEPVIEEFQCPDTVPEDYDVAQDPACVIPPATTDIEVATLAIYPGPGETHPYLMHPPIVGDLDGDGVPEIAITPYADDFNGEPGPLVVFDGATHAEKARTFGATAPWQPVGNGTPAIADIDRDGQVEVCTPGFNRAVVCYQLVGGQLVPWDLAPVAPETVSQATLAIADLDLDGRAEVIAGRQVIKGLGTGTVVVATGAHGRGARAVDGLFTTSFAADLVGGPELEVVAGRTLYAYDGVANTLLPVWQATNDVGAQIVDGYAAVADVVGDAAPEVILVTALSGDNGRVYVLDGATGQAIDDLLLDDFGAGGPPCIADLDGDGDAEIGIASQLNYYALEVRGGLSVRWASSATDPSSHQTGSSVFDFDGDGRAEVVYADELNVYILDGPGDPATQSTTVRAVVNEHDSGTQIEYPTIADVDADGEAEILFSSNGVLLGLGDTGLRIIENAHATLKWRPARPLWNQYAYAITNVNDDLTVPVVRDKNWLSFNNFRAAGTLGNPAPERQADLAVGPPEVCTEECADGVVVLHVPVENGGMGGAVSELALVIDAGGPSEATVGVASELVAAGRGHFFQRFEIPFSVWRHHALTAVADGGDVVPECDEGNNVRDLGRWPCGFSSCEPDVTGCDPGFACEELVDGCTSGSDCGYVCVPE